ncbi:class I tRNA ligase family protein [Mycoplasma sp. ATU-Cv-508]|uniref:class I tRNA ligase family protein n=1 Tax=Mycoplasma sp. ATU-Cv-508 TaxID=2048001 RepID=UPI000FDDAA89
MLGVLFDFVWKPATKPNYSELDRLVLVKLADLKKSVQREYQASRFNQVVNLVNLFVLELSSYYLEVSKDALYANAANDPERRAIQSVIYQVLIFVLQALAPVLPTTCEQAYQVYRFDQQKTSIFLTKIDYQSKVLPADLKRFKQFFELKDLVFKMVEEAKQAGQIGRSYAARVTLERKWPELENWDLAKLLMVGQVVWGKNNQVDTFESVKCVRCWNHYLPDQVNEESLCQRCQEVLVLQGASRV